MRFDSSDAHHGVAEICNATLLGKKLAMLSNDCIASPFYLSIPKIQSYRLGKLKALRIGNLVYYVKCFNLDTSL